MLGEYEYKNEFSRTHVMKGRVLGARENTLVVLKARGIEVSDEVRERIEHCADLDVLENWVVRAATATTADEVFD